MKRWLIPLVLTAYTVIIIMPPIIHGYVYPTNGDDSAVHLAFIQGYIDGEYSLSTVAHAYWGEAMMVVPIAWLHNTFGLSIDSMFLWLNYGVLWASTPAGP